MENSNLTSVKDCDYLDEDKEIRGQRFTCLSFISPESVIDNKNVSFFYEFIKDFSNKMSELFDNLKEKYKGESSSLDSLKDYYEYLFDQKLLQIQYKYFLEENNDKLERDYLENNNFQTSIRGVKVRGVYDTMREAQVRSEVLKRIDNHHNIYIGQVGCWLPFEPSPGNIENQEYAETQLNTLMKKYKENETLKDEQFEQRKQEMMKRKITQVEPKVITESELLQETKVIEGAPVDIITDNVVNEILDTEDPWMKQKLSQEVVEKVVEEVVEEVVDEGVEECKNNQ
jgi:hypothetical protein